MSSISHPHDLSWNWRELRKAEQRGQAARRECRYCGRRMVPGHMHSEDVCQGCAERELGVVH
jgi:hypothetical protein